MVDLWRWSVREVFTSLGYMGCCVSLEVNGKVNDGGLRFMSGSVKGRVGGCASV